MEIFVGEKCSDKFGQEIQLPRNSRDLLHAANLRHGAEGRRAEDFFALKNPTASAGFEPANLGTKGQHATSRPPKPPISPNCMFVNKNQKRIFLGFFLPSTVVFLYSHQYHTMLSWNKADSPNLPFARNAPTAFFVDMVYN